MALKSAGKVGELEREAKAAAAITCDVGSCKNRATTVFEKRNVCESCRADMRHEEARKFCESRGLRTVDEMRAYCRDQAKKFGRGPTFEDWAKNITQKTVDIAERMWGSDNDLLTRLRAEGAIDGRNKLIPAEARAVAKAAYLAERARQVVAAQAEIAAMAAAREPGADDEEAARA